MSNTMAITSQRMFNTDPSDEEQRIFQLQVQVGGITWAPNAMEHRTGGTVCALFQLLDYPPMEICQEAFCAECSHEDVKFRTGRLMVFALKRSDLIRHHNNFIVHIRVVQMTLKADRLPYRTEVATASIRLGSGFSAILSACFQPHVQHPGYKFVNDQVDLIDSSGEVVGVMNIFLRLSTFGSTIMGRLYADPDTQGLKVEPDVETQALVTQSRVATCAKRAKGYSDQGGPDKGPVFKEFRGACEDNNLIAARLYKLDSKLKSPEARADISHSDKTCHTTKATGGTESCEKACHTTEAKDGASIRERPRHIAEPGTLVLSGGEVLQQPDPAFVLPSNASSVHYRVTAQEDAPPRQQMLQSIPTPIQVPPTSVGPITGQPPNSKEDMYVLRVGKKITGHPMKTHLEVEVHTPKFVWRKKERFYKSTQYDKNDLVQPVK